MQVLEKSEHLFPYIQFSDYAVMFIDVEIQWRKIFIKKKNSVSMKQFYYAFKWWLIIKKKKGRKFR